MKFRVIYLFILLFYSTLGFSQLPAFTLDITPTNETCPFNGSVSMSLGNTAPGATILYSLYLLPNVTTPIDQFTQNSKSGLNDGNYRIIATQTLGNSSNSQTKDFTIVDQTVSLLFTVTQSISASCNLTGGVLTVNVTSGKAPFLYEIFSGPTTTSLQSSNVFSGLSAGDYIIRVVDACGTGEVLFYTLILDTTTLSIGATTSPPVATSCTSIDVFNTITPAPGTDMIYPLTVVYTIHPPIGPSETITEVFTTGPADELELMHTLQLLSQAYTYDLSVTDNCNQNFSLLGNLIDPNPTVSLSGTPNECGKEYLTVNVSNFSPPYTINFTDSPIGFNPVAFNPAHNNPFVVPSVVYGSDTNTVPAGNYSIEITDSCFRTSIANYVVIKVPIVINPIETKPSCDNPNGSIRIVLPDGRKIVSATLVSAHSNYTVSLPQNLASFINTAGVLFVPNLPVGPYVFSIVDNCGETHFPVNAEIDPFTVSPTLDATARFSCMPDNGSIRVRTPNGDLETLIITVAPSDFPHTIPYDVTSLINSSGIFYMNNLPEGLYKFEGTDACGTPLSASRTINGYDPGSNNYNLQRNCGSFHITVTDYSNIIGTYFFQKLDTNTNLWEHPDTGVDYVNTAVPPTSVNGLPLTNNNPLINRSDLGTFRIVKVIQVFEGGNATCQEVYGPFDFFDSLVIKNAFRLDCVGGPGPTSIYIDVEGAPPYVFRYRATPSSPYITNTTGNVFENLQPGILYDFQVEDNCGSQRLLSKDLASLLPLVVANDPVDANGNSELLECVENGETTATFNLRSFETSILGNQSPDNYVITYHRTPQDAASGSDPMSTPHLTTSNHETIYVRVEHKTIGICYDVTSFDLYVGQKPVITTSPDAYICDGGEVTIFAESGYQEYTWSTGETTSSITVDAPGTYTVTAKNIYGTSSCESDVKTIIVHPSGIPTELKIEVSDWTDNQNTITVVADGIGAYEYSLDGINYQPENHFGNLSPGVYKVFVKDTRGCGEFDDEVVLLNYPKFFTPNGDGYNDRWQIRFAALEPNMQIYIYDRYGKLLTGFDSKSSGWDGNYNGNQMPSTDYWFVVERADGRVFRGHFAMKR